MFIITGGGSGLGKALATSLAQHECPVLIIGRRLSLLQETAQCSSFIDYLCTDISTPEGRNTLIQHIKAIPRITGLINNAGTLNPVIPLRELSWESWQQAIHTNVSAPLFLAQQCYRQLEHGRVLNIGSGAAYFPIQSWAPYCVSKAALAMLTRCWQLESKEVAFASVMPGIVDTDMQALARLGVHMDKGQTEFYQNLYKNKRLLSADTVALFLTWLLLHVDKETFSAKEWDIYDTSHHQAWLKPPHEVPYWE